MNNGGSPWEDRAFALAVSEAARQRDDEMFRSAVHDVAHRTSETRDFSRSAYEELLHIDALSRRLQSLALAAADRDLPARERVIHTNLTRFTVQALREVDVVRDAAVIAAAADASARLRLATLGMSRTLPSGRLDLAARRRFDIARDSLLRPLIFPVSPIASAPGETLELKFLLDEAEYDWIRMVPSGDRRVPQIGRFAVSHRDARLLTGWSAAAFDTRLARGSRWDAVLDAARIDRTGAERAAVLFDPLKFALWWWSLSN